MRRYVSGSPGKGRIWHGIWRRTVESNLLTLKSLALAILCGSYRQPTNHRDKARARDEAMSSMVSGV